MLNQLETLVNEILGVIAGAAGSSLGVFVLSTFALLYFLPPVVAYLRSHNNTVPIFLVTLFWGWTGVGWILALTWGFTDNTAEPKIVDEPSGPEEVDESSTGRSEREVGTSDEGDASSSEPGPSGIAPMRSPRVLTITGMLSLCVVVLALSTLYFWLEATRARRTIAGMKDEVRQEKEKYVALKEDLIHEHVPGLEKFEGDDYLIEVNRRCLSHVAFEPRKNRALIRWVNRSRKSLKPSVSVNLYNQWGGRVGTLRSSWTFRSIQPGEADVEEKTVTTDGDFLYYDLEVSCE